MNPILPSKYFVPDGEAHCWQDGRMYIYGSMDLNGDTTYCSQHYQVFSSENLIDWVGHGVSFSTLDKKVGETWFESTLYAPDCIFKDGKYYLYFCTSGNGEGVATSDSPYGPFENPVAVKGAHLDAIDPTAFVDDDGQAYLYWGQFHCRGARLNADMTSIDETTLNTELINEPVHGFHEGPSVRKRNGLYYLVYTDTSRGKATCLAYATSKSPLGPFEKRGIIIDNDGCDPQSWNNHGSIAEFNGKWFVFYHRSSHNSKYSRRACAEPIQFNADGSINEVEMTTQGVSGPMDPMTFIEGGQACKIGGRGDSFARVLEPKDDKDTWKDCLTHTHWGTWAAYKYIDFDQPVTTFEAIVSSAAYGGIIDICLDSPEGEIIGKCIVSPTGGWEQWQTFACEIKKVSGIHAIYLVFQGRWIGRLMDLRGFRFY